jgi:hypothetical protein
LELVIWGSTLSFHYFFCWRLLLAYLLLNFLYCNICILTWLFSVKFSGHISSMVMFQIFSLFSCSAYYINFGFVTSSLAFWLQSLPPSTGELQRTECLRSLREITTPLAERPARGDLTGEVCHWADGYHLNVRLYEKLLLSVFDMLDEGKLTEVSAFGSWPW